MGRRQKGGDLDPSVCSAFPGEHVRDTEANLELWKVPMSLCSWDGKGRVTMTLGFPP